MATNHADILQELIGIFTDTETSDVKAESLLEELGLDSIAAVQLANEMFLKLQLQIHPDELFKISLNVLTEHLQKSPLPTSTGPKILAESDSAYEAAAHRSGFTNYWSIVSPLQNDLVLSYINEAFVTLGVDLSEQPCGVEISIPSCIPKYDRLMKRLLDILESRYIITQHGDKVLRGSDRIDVNTSSHLCEQLRIRHPTFECEANLLNLIGPRLADCLNGKLDPLLVLFGTVSSRQIMERFYHSAPMMAAHTEQLVYFFVNLTKRIAACSPSPVRILEVGAGTGGTTAPLVAALEDAKVSVNYTFTDIGVSFIHKARGRWGRNQWMDFATLDIEEEMPESFNAQYDIVIGTNVVHATRDRAETCRRLREVLRPGGVLVLSELTRPIVWYDICFGLLDGWWLSDDYAIQPTTVWMDALRMAGFKSTGHSKGNSEEANTQRLLVACNQD
ncbi:S-adenosyl-L-methionine-dependent methyltransferase [Xylaria venustula]|nr:S-adenosyl-L-methionine-dependent methyltransferase [Xylaria venustula]